MEDTDKLVGKLVDDREADPALFPPLPEGRTQLGVRLTLCYGSLIYKVDGGLSVDEWRAYRAGLRSLQADIERLKAEDTPMTQDDYDDRLIDLNAPIIAGVLGRCNEGNQFSPAYVKAIFSGWFICQAGGFLFGRSAPSRPDKTA